MLRFEHHEDLPTSRQILSLPFTYPTIRLTLIKVYRFKNPEPKIVEFASSSSLTSLFRLLLSTLAPATAKARQRILWCLNSGDNEFPNFSHPLRLATFTAIRRAWEI